MSSAAAETRENRMGTMPVRKLLVSMSIPMMISMLVQALYNIVDSAFVDNLRDIRLPAQKNPRKQQAGHDEKQPVHSSQKQADICADIRAE